MTPLIWSQDASNKLSVPISKTLCGASHQLTIKKKHYSFFGIDTVENNYRDNKHYLKMKYEDVIYDVQIHIIYEYSYYIRVRISLSCITPFIETIKEIPYDDVLKKRLEITKFNKYYLVELV